MPTECHVIRSSRDLYSSIIKPFGCSDAIFRGLMRLILRFDATPRCVTSRRISLMSPRKIASEHPKGLMIEEYKSLLERITWHSVGIVNLLAQVSYEDRRMPDALGSGTLCTWNGHHLTLTAKPVVEKTPTDKLGCLLRVDDIGHW